MFSYRHAFHAGNHADVLKHITLLETLRYLLLKDTALQIVDTHAGGGLYAMGGDFAQKSMEADGGINKLWEQTDLPQPVEDYLQAIHAYNPNGLLKIYPGSPALIWNLLRPQDKLDLFELHPNEQRVLQSNVRQLDMSHQIKVHVADGFKGLRALLPPPSRRGLVLMDPSYEMKNNYHLVQDCISEALQRFATGVYIVWYPVIALPQSHQLAGKLKKLTQNAGKKWLNATLKVRNPQKDLFGLIESGVFVINPPFVLQEKLKQSLPYLAKQLSQGKGAGYELEASSS